MSAATVESRALAVAGGKRAFAPARDVFVTTVFILVAIGTVMVASASAFLWSIEGDAFFFLRRQLAWLPIAALACIFLREIDYRVLRQRYWLPLAVSLVLLALVLVPQLGRNVNASRRWLPVAGGLQFQPSELAKLAVIVFIAGFLAGDPERARRFVRGFLAVSLAILLAFALVLIEPDFGTALFILGLSTCVLLLGGMRKRYFIATAFLFAPIIALFAHWRWEQVQMRLLGFLDPEKLYQVKHSLTALGSGGLFGVGLGASGEKLRFLPEPHTDFILAIVGEELGFAGTFAVLLLFVAFLWSGIAIAGRTRDPFGFLLGSGIVLSLSVQAAINVAVVTASVPTKGIPLPFLTFGGSGLTMTLAQVGILLSIDRVNARGEPSPGAPPAGLAERA